MVRSFLTKMVAGLAISVLPACTLSGCSSNSRTVSKQMQVQKIELSDLINNPSKYDGKEVITKGYPEYVGGKNYFMAYPYYDAITEDVKISLSEVTLTTHNLHVLPNPKSDYFVITEREGGLYLPIPIVLSGGSVYKNKLEVRGKVLGDNKGKYQLSVYSTAEVEK